TCRVARPITTTSAPSSNAGASGARSTSTRRSGASGSSTMPRPPSSPRQRPSTATSPALTSPILRRDARVSATPSALLRPRRRSITPITISGSASRTSTGPNATQPYSFSSPSMAFRSYALRASWLPSLDGRQPQLHRLDPQFLDDVRPPRARNRAAEPKRPDHIVYAATDHVAHDAERQQLPRRATLRAPLVGGHLARRVERPIFHAAPWCGAAPAPA